MVYRIMVECAPVVMMNILACHFRALCCLSVVMYERYN